MKPTHTHSYNGIEYCWDGEKWWYLSPVRSAWVQAEFVVIQKLIKIE